MKLDSFTFTTTGGRDENQDSVGKYEQGDCGVYVVADGLGGHAMGSAASEIIVTTLLSESLPFGTEALRSKIAASNDGILALQAKHNCVAKSTVAALSVQGDRAYWANTGDSRVYYFHNDQQAFVTADHSVAYKKYRAGEITRAQIAEDEDQSCLLRALGGQSRWEPEAGMLERVSAGDAFLLCSDGLWEYVLDEEMLAELLKAETARDWARALLLRALDRVKPGHDNLTLITVMVQ